MQASKILTSEQEVIGGAGCLAGFLILAGVSTAPRDLFPSAFSRPCLKVGQ
jgi:hypothetical protein